jgi:hypothetical protein
MWLFPAWTVGVVALLLAFGIAPNQAPPPPMISGAILGAIAAAALLVDRQRFFDPALRATTVPAAT